jgi:hypothetical protein
MHTLIQLRNDFYFKYNLSRKLSKISMTEPILETISENDMKKSDSSYSISAESEKKSSLRHSVDSRKFIESTVVNSPS